jgi:hypothetical protein
MNKRTKILFIIYLIIAPIVYFISSAHTPQIEKFARENINTKDTKYTAIAFVNDDARSYQQALKEVFGNKSVKLLLYLPSNQQSTALQALPSNDNVYVNNRYFVKAGIKIDSEAPSLQLFIVNKKQQLVFQEQFYHPTKLKSSRLLHRLHKS